MRALSLVHALHSEGYLSANKSIAVIGGGAAGMSLAAAIALVTESQVVLFEKGADLLPLQSATSRRKLDPHIFDWPDWDTDDPIADLPILDWSAGPARDVRADVVAGFDGVVAALGPRLSKRTRSEVTSINPIADTFEVVFQRDPRPGKFGLRIEDRDRFAHVFLCIGFGLEPEQTVPGIQNHSYWSDAGVPLDEFQGRAQPRFFISGNGDGGLIDLVAAGSAAFDHARMIRIIVMRPGIGEVFGLLQAIDARAREAELCGHPFDFISAYDSEVMPSIERLGLVPAVSALLRPGVQLTFQTLGKEMFVLATSTLNRLAAYLTIKACELDHQCSFQHVHCADVVSVDAPLNRERDALFWLDCAGTIVGVDSVIIRRGPDRVGVRAPFAALLDGFEKDHKAWLARHGNSTLVPVLSPQARKLFENAARDAHVPLARHIQAARWGLRVEIGTSPSRSARTALVGVGAAPRYRSGLDRQGRSIRDRMPCRSSKSWTRRDRHRSAGGSCLPLPHYR